METIRQKKVQEFIKQEVSYILANKLSDPRVKGIVSVVSVKVSKDLRRAKIYMSLLGSDAQKRTLMRGLESSKKFIQKELAMSFKSKVCPTLEFLLDTSIEESIAIDLLIQRARSTDIDHIHSEENEEEYI